MNEPTNTNQNDGQQQAGTNAGGQQQDAQAQNQQAPQNDPNASGHQAAQALYGQVAPPPPQQQSTTQPPQSPANQGFQPVTIGGRVFNSQADLNQFTESLYTANAQALQAQQQAQAPAQPAATTAETDDAELSELIWKDPAEYTRRVEARAENKVRQTIESQKQVDKFWTDFYQKNTDLQGYNVLIDDITNANITTLGPKSFEDAEKFIAERARSVLQLANKGTGTQQQLASAPATTLGTTSGSVPAPTQQPQPETTFVDELRAHKAKRRAAATR